eukprot:gene4399-8755_t
MQLCRTPFSSQGIANALVGLQSSSSTSASVKILLSLLKEKIYENKDVFKAHELSGALFGMQGMSSGEEEVRGVLAALEPKFMTCTDQFIAQDIGKCFVGLNSMDYTVSEVAAIASQMSIKIAMSEFKGQPNLQFLLFGKSIRVKVDDSYEYNVSIEKMD